MSRRRLTNHLDKIKAASTNGLRRQITDDFKYDKKSLKHIKHILHNVNIALGTLVSALNEFSRLKGPNISPDGLLGGYGYIIPIKNIKETIDGSVRNLSDIADCLADELTNPKWDAEDDKDVKELIKEKEKVEEKVEEEMEKSDEEISPDDVITSNDVKTAALSKTSQEALSKAITDMLIKTSSIKM